MDIGFVTQPERTVWFDFPGDDDVRVCVCYLSLDKQAEIERLASIEISEPVPDKPGALDGPAERLVRQVDEKEYNRLVGRAVVRGWSGLKDGDKDFPYTPENCDMLMTKWNEFSTFVGLVCPRLRLLVEAERKAAEKKSGTTSGQGTTSQG